MIFGIVPSFRSSRAYCSECSDLCAGCTPEDVCFRCETVELEATEVFDPEMCAYVSAWECPDECGRQLYREEGGEVEFKMF